MKHTKTFCALLAVVFVFLSSFRDHTGMIRTDREADCYGRCMIWFDFTGSVLTDTRVPSNYQAAAFEETACDGEQGAICQVFVLSNASMTLPDADALDLLIEEAEVCPYTAPGVHNAGTYTNGSKLRVIPVP